MYAYVCLSCVSVSMCVSLYPCACVSLCIRAYVYVSMCVSVNACVCISMFTSGSMCVYVSCVQVCVCLKRRPSGQLVVRWRSCGSEGGPGDPGDGLKPPQCHITPRDLRKEARKGNKLVRGPRSCWPKHTCALLHLLQNAGPSPVQPVLLVGQPL